MSNVAEQLGLIDHEAEETVLGAMLVGTQQAIALAQELQAEDFYDPRRKVLFQAMTNVLLGIEPFNKAIVLAECRRVADEMNKRNPVKVSEDYVDGLPKGGHGALQNAIMVHRLSWLRQAGDYAFWLVKELQMNPDPNILYTEAQSRWQVLAPGKSDGATLYGWDTIKFGREIAEKRKHEASEGLTRRFDWPWASWNDKIRPGIAGWVGVLAAPDGVGKSTYLDYIAEHWAQRGNKTVLVHLEDNHQYKIDRRKARYSKVPLATIEDGLTSPIQDRAIEESEREMAGWAANLHYTHAPGWSMAQILDELNKLIDEGECECVVLDYIDNAEADKRQVQLYGNNHYLREGDNMKRLKDWAEQCKLPVFTATQGNKGMQDQGRTKTRQDIDGSGKKSQRAQLVIILTRDIVGVGGLWDEGKQIAKEGDYSPIATLRIDKQNRGEQTTFFQVFRGDCYRIGDVPNGFMLSNLKQTQ